MTSASGLRQSAVAEEPHRLADFSESESAKCRQVGLVIDLAATDDTLVPGRRRQVRRLATEDLSKAAEGRSIVVAKGAIRHELQARPPGRGPVPALDVLRPAIQHAPALIALVAQKLAFGFGTCEGQRVGAPGPFVPAPAMHETPEGEHDLDRVAMDVEDDVALEHAIQDAVEEVSGMVRLDDRGDSSVRQGASAPAIAGGWKKLIGIES